MEWIIFFQYLRSFFINIKELSLGVLVIVVSSAVYMIVNTNGSLGVKITEDGIPGEEQCYITGSASGNIFWS